MLESQFTSSILSKPDHAMGLLETNQNEEKYSPRGKIVKTSLTQNKSVPIEKAPWTGIFHQSIYAFIVTIVMISFGMPIGYSAILLPQLETKNTSVTFNEEIGSWIASIHSCATPVGAVLGGFLMDHFGRIRSLQLSITPLIVGWSLIATANHYIVIIVGRFLAGFSVGCSSTTCAVLVAEICEPYLRGFFSSIQLVGYSFGILLVYLLGWISDWRLVAGLALILPVLTLISFFFLSDTPTWLIRKGRIGEATQVMDWLRGGSSQTDKEIQQLIQRAYDEEHENNNYTRSGTFLETKSWWEIFTLPQVLKPFLILVAFSMIQVLSGTFIVVYYAVNIISQMDDIGLDNESMAIVTALIRFVFTIVATILIAFIGRRPLAMISCFGSGICAFLLGIIIFIKTNSVESQEKEPYYLYISVICLIGYVAFNTIGLMPILPLLVSELLPAKVRGSVGGLTYALFNIFVFIFTKLFPLVKQSIGISGLFNIFGVTSLIGVIFMYYVLPETKGASLAEIEEYFEGDNILWVTRNKSRTPTNKTTNNSMT